MTSSYILISALSVVCIISFFYKRYYKKHLIESLDIFEKTYSLDKHYHTNSEIKNIKKSLTNLNTISDKDIKVKIDRIKSKL